MGRILMVALIAAAGWVGWVFHTEGTDKAFGGILAPVESVRDPEANPALRLSPAAQAASAPVGRPQSRAGRITRGVRDRANRAMDTRR